MWGERIVPAEPYGFGRAMRPAEPFGLVGRNVLVEPNAKDMPNADGSAGRFALPPKGSGRPPGASLMDTIGSSQRARALLCIRSWSARAQTAGPFHPALDRWPGFLFHHHQLPPARAKSALSSGRMR